MNVNKIITFNPIQSPLRVYIYRHGDYLRGGRCLLLGRASSGLTACIGSMGRSLLHEDEEDGGYEATEGGQMVPLQGLVLEKYEGECRENYEGDRFLYHLELGEGEVASVALEAVAVGRHHHQIFHQGYAP